MLVSNPNDVKIYNLSGGKSLPEWISERKRRKLERTDTDIRRRVELIQDFGMPDVSGCVRCTNDGQYVYVTGTYKPRIRCYELSNLSMKFERCLDAEVIKMLNLSHSYEKLVFLEEDRFVELHVQYGRYFRTRMPKFGRDMAYHEATCDLYLIGSGPDIYRLNLEEGRYMSPLTSDASSLTACTLNPHHGLFVCGTWEGKIEAWDPRTRRRAAVLDCVVGEGGDIDSTESRKCPFVSALKFKDALSMAVGMSSGKTLMYDIRSDKPLLVKDQQYGLPIKSLDFNRTLGLVLSMDSKVVKLWDQQTGKPYTAIEPGPDLNELCLLPESGLVFLSNESPKVITFYVPSLGPAPKWCSFLDNITEELEETEQASVYDDYKFVTQDDLQDLGLTHLVGSNLLRAYMHGYFMDARLHAKAKQLVDPFALDEYKKRKMREKLEEERKAQVPARKSKLPKINKELAQRLLLEHESQPTSGKKKTKIRVANELLEDNRFAELFQNPDFQVDPNSEEFRLMNPAIAKLEKAKKKRKDKLLAEKFEKIAESNLEEEEVEGRRSSEEGSSEGEDSSSDDDQEFTQQIRQTHKDLKFEKIRDDRQKAYEERVAARAAREERIKEPKIFALRSGEEFEGWSKELEKGKLREDVGKMSLGERRAMESEEGEGEGEVKSVGASREMTFTLSRKSKSTLKEERQTEHLNERKKVRRSAGEINKALDKQHKLPGTQQRKFRKK